MQIEKSDVDRKQKKIIIDPIYLVDQRIEITKQITLTKSSGA